MTRAWTLASHPAALPTPADFRLAEIPTAPMADDMVRVANRWLSVDPYMRGLMNPGETHMPSYAIGKPLTGGAIGEVIESRSSSYAPGDIVLHLQGWREEAVLPAAALTLLPPIDELRLYLGVLGISGFSAYRGLFEIGEIKAGQTLFVSAAAGAVGTVVVQLARLSGLRVIGSAGGAGKCAMVASLGADATIDYKAGVPIAEALRQAAPDGIDVYFDNVGGDHLDAALGAARMGARFILCGMIDRYNSTAPTELHNIRRIMRSRLRLEGLMNNDMSGMPAYRAKMEDWLASGAVRSIDTVRTGLEAAPEALIDLFSGGNVGKMVVRL